MPRAKAAAKTANIHAVVGSDEAEVKRVASQLAAQLTPEAGGDFGVEVIDACADNADQAASRIRAAIEALQTLPFFGGEKLVWMKNANCFADSPIGRAAGVQEALEELAELLQSGLAPGVTLLISATETDKRRSFYKTLTKLADVQVIDKLDASRAGWEEEAFETVRSRVRNREMQFDDDALELFVLLTGGDTRQIDSELEKLDLYCGEARITSATVRELVPLSRAGVIFELGNALSAGELDRALSLVKRLLDQGESAIGILLVALVPTIRSLLLAKDLMEQNRLGRPSAPFAFISAVNRLPASATEHLPRKKDGSVNTYALGFAAMNVHRFTKPQLITGLESCLQANVQLVSSQLDHELVLTEIVVKLLAPETR